MCRAHDGDTRGETPACPHSPSAHPFLQLRPWCRALGSKLTLPLAEARGCAGDGWCLHLGERLRGPGRPPLGNAPSQAEGSPGPLPCFLRASVRANGTIVGRSPSANGPAFLSLGDPRGLQPRQLLMRKCVPYHTVTHISASCSASAVSVHVSGRQNQHTTCTCSLFVRPADFSCRRYVLSVQSRLGDTFGRTLACGTLCACMSPEPAARLLPLSTRAAGLDSVCRQCVTRFCSTRGHGN